MKNWRKKSLSAQYFGHQGPNLALYLSIKVLRCFRYLLYSTYIFRLSMIDQYFGRQQPNRALLSKRPEIWPPKCLGHFCIIHFFFFFKMNLNIIYFKFRQQGSLLYLTCTSNEVIEGHIGYCLILRYIIHSVNEKCSITK